MRIYKTKREVLEQLGLGFTDYQAFKRKIDKGEVYEVWYGDRAGYVIFNEVLRRVDKELLKKC